MKRRLTLLIYSLVLLFTPLLALNSLISGRYVAGLYEKIPLSEPRLSDTERLGLALVAVHFLESRAPAGEAIALLATQSWPQGGGQFYAHNELDHMVDVKHRVAVANALMWFSGLGITAIWVWTRRDGAKISQFWESLQNAAAFVTMISLGMSLMVILFWPLVNVYFHALLFRGMDGNWQFSADSGLITLFPIDFWFAVALSWVSRTLGIASVGILIGGVQRYRLLNSAEYEPPDSGLPELLPSA